MWLWVWGAIRLWRDHSVFRVLPLIWLSCFVVFVITAGQGYYTAGTYPALIAAGAVVLEGRVRRPALVLGVAVVTAAIACLRSCPCSPRTGSSAAPGAGRAENQFETVGWPDLVDQVATTYDGLPASQRARTTILTINYGEAGAIARYGPSHGLPTAYSGHNGFADWGPPPQRDTSVIAVWEGGAPSQLRRCHRVAAVHNRDGVSNEEIENAAIYVCEAPAQGWRCRLAAPEAPGQLSQPSGGCPSGQSSSRMRCRCSAYSSALSSPLSCRDWSLASLASGVCAPGGPARRRG